MLMPKWRVPTGHKFDQPLRNVAIGEYARSQP